MQYLPTGQHMSALYLWGIYFIWTRLKNNNFCELNLNYHYQYADTFTQQITLLNKCTYLMNKINALKNQSWEVTLSNDLL